MEREEQERQGQIDDAVIEAKKKMEISQGILQEIRNCAGVYESGKPINVREGEPVTMTTKVLTDREIIESKSK